MYGAGLNKYGAGLNKYGAVDTCNMYGAVLNKYGAGLNKYGAVDNKYGPHLISTGPQIISTGPQIILENIFSQSPYRCAVTVNERYNVEGIPQNSLTQLQHPWYLSDNMSTQFYVNKHCVPNMVKLVT
jgi:hypothetical protein